MSVLATQPPPSNRLRDTLLYFRRNRPLIAGCALLLVIGYTLLRGPGWRTVVISLAVASLTGVANAWLRPEIETAYASYLVLPVQYEGAINGRALKNNSSFASLIDDSEPPLYARYIRHIRSLLLDELGFRERRILVLGAGGFTLSHREPSNHYTYVDIDPAVRGIAEKHFLGEAARGEFIADDARRFVIRSEQRFAAVVLRPFVLHLQRGPRHGGHRVDVELIGRHGLEADLAQHLDDHRRALGELELVLDRVEAREHGAGVDHVAEVVRQRQDAPVDLGRNRGLARAAQGADDVDPTGDVADVTGFHRHDHPGIGHRGTRRPRGA